MLNNIYPYGYQQAVDSKQHVPKDYLSQLPLAFQQALTTEAGSISFGQSLTTDTFVSGPKPKPKPLPFLDESV